MSEETKNISQGTSSSDAGNIIKDILSGGILTRDIIQTHFRFFIFIIFLGIAYIGNRYHSEYVLKKTAIVQKELKDAQAESIIVSSQLLSLKKQSKIIQSVNKHHLGLKPLTKPARKLVINE